MVNIFYLMSFKGEEDYETVHRLGEVNIDSFMGFSFGIDLDGMLQHGKT